VQKKALAYCVSFVGTHRLLVWSFPTHFYPHRCVALSLTHTSVQFLCTIMCRTICTLLCNNPTHFRALILHTFVQWYYTIETWTSIDHGISDSFSTKYLILRYRYRGITDTFSISVSAILFKSIVPNPADVCINHCISNDSTNKMDNFASAKIFLEISFSYLQKSTGVQCKTWITNKNTNANLTLWTSLSAYG
jgi:hypothetical protein